MKDIPYTFHEKYILRTPALSVCEVENISSKKIRSLCSDSFISEAIYLTSPELHLEMQKYLLEEEVTNIKLESTLLKFLLRMSNRCTPFGLFAGVSLGLIKNNTEIELKNLKDFKRKTRLDMNYLCSLVQDLEADNALRNSLLYFPNSSLYKVGKEYRYIEYKYINTLRHHYMISIDASEYIERIVRLSEKGASIKEMVNSIISEEISVNDADNFITNLIDNQILISSISPTVSGDDYLDFIEEKTNQPWLKEIKQAIKNLDNKIIHKDLSLYKVIMEELEIQDIPFNKKFLFQTDLLVTSVSNSLDKAVIDDINKALIVLNKLKTRVKNPILEGFKNAFYERYEDEEMPLSMVLDVEVGIGYDQSLKYSYDVCPLVDDLVISNTNKNQSNQVALKKASKIISEKINVAKNENTFEVILKDADLNGLVDNWNDLPETFPLIASVFKNNNHDPIVALSHIGGPTANYLAGRFGHISDDVKGLLQEITLKEKVKENTVLAEVVHLPESRTGNILYRSNLRKYEIPYLAKSNLPSDNQIPISDIYVSIVNDKIILRSKKLNKLIEPRVANAHAFWGKNTLPLYHFLCDMQSQDLCPYLDFTWNSEFVDYTFLPRMRYRNIILSRAEWHFKNKQIKNLEELMHWKKEFDIPDTFFIVDGDNELLINLKNNLSCEIFLKEIKNNPLFILKECLTENFDSVVEQDGLKYANEFMFFLHKN